MIRSCSAALDLLKAMKILDKGRPGPAGPQAQTR